MLKKIALAVTLLVSLFVFVPATATAAPDPTDRSTAIAWWSADHHKVETQVTYTLGGLEVVQIDGKVSDIATADGTEWCTAHNTAGVDNLDSQLAAVANAMQQAGSPTTWSMAEFGPNRRSPNFTLGDYGVECFATPDNS